MLPALRVVIPLVARVFLAFVAFGTVAMILRAFSPVHSTSFQEKHLGDVDCSMEVSSIDAALVLQFDAQLLNALQCPELADISGDDRSNSLDALLILQLVAGLKPPPAHMLGELGVYTMKSLGYKSLKLERDGGLVFPQLTSEPIHGNLRGISTSC